MRNWSDKERSLVPIFDRALALRDAGRLHDAVTLLASLVEQLTLDELLLLVHAHLQLGYITKLLGNVSQSCEHFATASRLAPKQELASLGLFHALCDQGRATDAYREMVRFLGLRDSEMYRGFATGTRTEWRRTIASSYAKRACC